MMKLKYPICCGLDVHKNVIVATIVITNRDGVSEYRQKSFSTINSDIQKFHNWLIENNCYHVCMESTGKYWIPIFNYLEKDIEVCLTHPKYVKAIKGKKTDKKDSKWIADLYKFDLVRCSFIPPKDFRQLRELARYRFKLVCMKSSEKNRIQNCMTVSNVGIASVLSDPFGKTATEIMSYLLEHTADSIDEKAVRKLIKKGAKAKSDEIIEAIRCGTCRFPSAKFFQIRIHRRIFRGCPCPSSGEHQIVPAAAQCRLFDTRPAPQKQRDSQASAAQRDHRHSSQG